MKTITIILLGLLTLITSPNSVNPERTKLLDQVFLLLEENVANPDWLKKESFIDFKRDMYSDKVMNLSDEKFLSYFKEQRKTLPFSHFDLKFKKRSVTTGTSTTNEPVLYWKALNKNIAYLRVNTFDSDAEPMVKAVSEIGINKFDHLIIDLRDNGGGNLDAPVVLGRFLTQDYIDAGVYFTRKWFTEEKRSATPEDYAAFPFLKDFTYDGIFKMYREEKAFRMVLPPHKNPVYQGKVYVLINSNTASACEPLIDLLQKKNIATLVGPRSAGNMLTGEYFPVNENYDVFIPIADYQTANGDRLDLVGVTPNHKVRSEKTLDYVLNELIQK